MKKLEEESTQLSFFDEKEIPFFKFYPALLFVAILICFLMK